MFRNNVKKSRADKVSLDASFQKDLGLDSMRLVSILLELEEALSLDISEQEDLDLAQIKTVRDLIALARELVAA